MHCTYCLSDILCHLSLRSLTERNSTQESWIYYTRFRPLGEIYLSNEIEAMKDFPLVEMTNDGDSGQTLLKNQVIFSVSSSF